jgi:hypothetical protein
MKKFLVGCLAVLGILFLLDYGPESFAQSSYHPMQFDKRRLNILCHAIPVMSF